MSIQNGERLVTKQDLADFYNDIRPYMGGLVSSKAGFTPIGTIISVMGTTAPVNYLACDGTVYNIADYTELANYFNEQFGSKNFFGGNGTTTFAVPDLRGEFLRGTGTNSHENQGSGANVGVHQDGTESPRYYGYSENNYNSVGVVGIIENSSISLKKVDSEQSVSGRNLYVAGATNTPVTASIYTTRPTNTSVLYCIATKNFYIDPTLDYSTDEKVVGTWIDSKPIYQKTVAFNVNQYADSNDRRTFTLFEQPNVDTDIDLKVHHNSTTVIGTTMQSNASMPSTIQCCNGSIFANNTMKVIVQISKSSFSPIPTSVSGYLTIQYTKTTS